MKALIVGAGIAGAATALALERVGIEAELVDAYERSAGLDQGVFLTVAVNGLAAFDALGVGDAVRAAGFATRHMHFTSGRGKALGTLPNGPAGADVEPTRTVRRAELYRVLTDAAAARGVELRSGRRLTAIADDDEGGAGVRATFADGSSATADVLVGADGLRSTVRALLDPSAAPPRFSGLLNVGGFSQLPAGEVDPRGGDYQMIYGRHVFFGFAIAPDGEVSWFANPGRRQPLSEEERRADPGPFLEALARQLDDDAGPAARIVRATTGDVLIGNGYDLPPVTTWHAGRAVLVGDAAHAVSPATGQGASLAAEDAVVLARQLAHARDAAATGPGPGATSSAAIATALAAYEAERRPRAERVMAYGKRLGSTKAAGPVGRVLRDALLPHGLRYAASPKMAAKQAWLYDERVTLGLSRR